MGTNGILDKLKRFSEGLTQGAEQFGEAIAPSKFTPMSLVNAQRAPAPNRGIANILSNFVRSQGLKQVAGEEVRQQQEAEKLKRLTVESQAQNLSSLGEKRKADVELGKFKAETDRAKNDITTAKNAQDFEIAAQGLFLKEQELMDKRDELMFRRGYDQSAQSIRLLETQIHMIDTQLAIYQSIADNELKKKAQDLTARGHAVNEGWLKLAQEESPVKIARQEAEIGKTEAETKNLEAQEQDKWQKQIASALDILKEGKTQGVIQRPGAFAEASGLYKALGVTPPTEGWRRFFGPKQEATEGGMKVEKKEKTSTPPPPPPVVSRTSPAATVSYQGKMYKKEAGKVLMASPDGSVVNVGPSELEAAKKAGYKEIK